MQPDEKHPTIDKNNETEVINSPKQPLVTWKRVKLLAIGLILIGLGYFIGSDKIQLFGRPYPANTGLSRNINYHELDDLYDTLRQNYDGNMTDKQVLDGLKHGLAQSTGDPYTDFMTATEAKEFNGDLQGTFSGIGARLELDDNKNVIVAAPLVGSPAEAAGLRAKDVIADINGESTYRMSVADAVKKIRGEKGTKVKLVILRGGSERLDFAITRDTIKIDSVVYKKVAQDKIGYIQVSQFSNDTDELIQAAADSLKKDGIKKVILDMRDNPGGEISTAVNLSSLWLKQGDPVVQQRRGKQVIDTKYANNNNQLHGLDTVVLLNAGSASASEITALALKDNGAAVIMGEQSYGKGVVQQLFPFNDGSSLKVTIAKWYSPAGTNVDKKGVKPDREVKMTEADYKSGNDAQLNAAIEYLSAR